MGRFVAFGEIILRLKPPGHERLLQSPALEAVFGGAEANVAVSLAGFGLDAEFVTAVPDNDLGAAAIAELRRFGVGTRDIVRRGARLGLYFIEAGADQRPSKVLYDRSGSAIATAPRDTFDWPALLDGAAWLHVSGITPALSETAAEITLTACRAAKARGVTVSCDCNYRGKLWNYGKRPTDVMTELVQQVDLLIASREDCAKCLGIAAPLRAPQGGGVDIATHETLTAAVLERFPNLTSIAITLRESQSADRNAWSACMRDASTFRTARRYEMAAIVDRVGGGDAFAAGLIFGWQAYSDDRARALEFAVAAGCLKHSIPGDFNRVSVAEVEALLEGDGGGRVQR
jgi:2-dehydro-3-deoxygluconokinase